jgi:hypothetical protein
MIEPAVLRRRPTSVVVFVNEPKMTFELSAIS